MQVGYRHPAEPAMQLDASFPEFAHQPLPFVFELPFGHCNASRQDGSSELRAVEVIPSGNRLLMHRKQIQVDRSARSAAGAEALELGVVSIADGAAVQDVARKESFAPQRDQ